MLHSDPHPRLSSSKPAYLRSTACHRDACGNDSHGRNARRDGVPRVHFCDGHDVNDLCVSDDVPSSRGGGVCRRVHDGRCGGDVLCHVLLRAHGRGDFWHDHGVLLFYGDVLLLFHGRAPHGHGQPCISRGRGSEREGPDLVLSANLVRVPGFGHEG